MECPNPPLTVADLLATARASLADPREAPILVAHALGLPREVLYAHPETPISIVKAERARALVARRVAGEPVAYLTGFREFYGLALTISPDVLIPRPETELLVELALARLERLAAPVVADLGTGSGAIALAIAHARPEACVIATDRSAAALAVATANARRVTSLKQSPIVSSFRGSRRENPESVRHSAVAVRIAPTRVRNDESTANQGFLGKVAFVRTDWLAPFAPQSFDLIVANPPYVAAGDPHLAAGDLRFEPIAALAAGADGLTALRRLIPAAINRLKPGGALIVEHGAEQQPAVRALFAESGYANIEAHRDLAGLLRAVSACNPAVKEAS